MKLAAIALALAVLALGIGTYGVASPLPRYKAVHRLWMRGGYGGFSGFGRRNNDEHERLGEERHELRLACQNVVFLVVPPALAALVLAFLARRKQRGPLPLAAFGVAGLALVLTAVILAADVF